MTNYANGATLERAVKKLFEANGYYVMKSGGSKGPADLIALKRGETVLIQCKLDGYLRPGEVRRLWDLGMLLESVVIVACWHKEGRAARTVRLMHMCYGDDRPNYLDWSPDWALEES